MKTLFLIMLDNMCLTPQYLNKLSSRERYMMAGNEMISVYILEQLANDRVKEIRQRVAENPRTPAAVLASLAVDTDYEIRLSVADHPKTPASILEVLAQDDHNDVRYGIAENPNISEYILRILCRDENPFVACRAEQTLEVLESQRRQIQDLVLKAGNRVARLVKNWNMLPHTQAV